MLHPQQLSLSYIEGDKLESAWKIDLNEPSYSMVVSGRKIFVTSMFSDQWRQYYLFESLEIIIFSKIKRLVLKITVKKIKIEQNLTHLLSRFLFAKEKLGFSKPKSKKQPFYLQKLRT